MLAIRKSILDFLPAAIGDFQTTHLVVQQTKVCDILPSSSRIKVLAILFSKKCSASSRRKLFRSLSPQSKPATFTLGVKGITFILLPTECNQFLCFLNPFLECFAASLTFFRTAGFHLLHLLDETLSIFTRQNRCFSNRSCHSCIFLVSYHNANIIVFSDIRAIIMPKSHFLL